jgi:predicted oxidoreductase (fatty acid repression mutant protein)
MSPAAKMAGNAEPFLETMASRRTIYALDKYSPVPQSRIEEIIRNAILHVPSCFNSQSTRIMLLVGEEHDKLWEIVKESVKAVAPAEIWPTSEKRLNGFKAGYGTVRLTFSPLAALVPFPNALLSPPHPPTHPSIGLTYIH